MFFPTKRPTRRQFLERSVLGAGSVLLAPMLLDSCTDHLIPPPTPNPVQVPAADGGPDWNDAAKIALTTGLGLEPQIGGIPRALTTIFWPSSGLDVWGQVKAQIEALINQQIGDTTYRAVKDKLDDLKGLIDDFLNAINDNGDVLGTWKNAQAAFSSSQDLFKLPGLEVVLLPFFAQFANLYISLCHDGAFYGTQWGMSLGDQQQAATDLTNYIQGAIQYTTSTYGSGRADIIKNTKRDDLKCEPFRSTNAYDRQITLTVLDYMDSWKYYDIYQYPFRATNPDGTPINIFTREIYSDPYGNINNGQIVLPSPATQFPTQLTVWGGHDHDNDYHIFAVQLTYPAGGGPGGVTTTSRMGVQDGGTNQPPYGGTFSIANNPIAVIVVSPEKDSYVEYDLIDTLRFGFSDRTISWQMGQQQGGGPQVSVVSYSHMILSSIYIHGSAFITINNYAADCIVFGFMRLPPV